MHNALRILVVDDYEDTLIVLKSFFATRGIDCDIAGGAREAIAKFNSACDAGMYCYDAIVMDVDLPRVSGIGLLKVIRQVHESLPMFVFTAYDSEIVRQKAKELNAAVFEKHAPDVTQLVDSVCNTAREYRASNPNNTHARVILPEIVERMYAHQNNFEMDVI